MILWLEEIQQLNSNPTIHKQPNSNMMRGSNITPKWDSNQLRRLGPMALTTLILIRQNLAVSLEHRQMRLLMLAV